MSIIKYIATADTTITNAFKPNSNSRAFYANMGAADSLEVFSIGHSGSQPEKSRILLRFPIDKIAENRLSGKIPQSGSVRFYFNLYNVQHPETLPNNYDLLIKPISGSWDEGYGLDIETYLDSGQKQNSGIGVNWKFRSTTDIFDIWVAEGGDFWSGYDKTYHLDKGYEDINIDVTNIIEDQLSSIISSDGLCVMLSGSFEDLEDNINFYTKRFSARSSEYFYKLPSIEARWESIVKDDRGRFYYSSPNIEEQYNIQSIYFYNKINGALKNLPNNTVPLVKIVDDGNNELLNNITSENIATGVYKASFSITGSGDNDVVDIWYSGSSVYYSGGFTISERSFDDTFVDDDYIFNITNLKSNYKKSEYCPLRVFCRTKNWSPNLYKTYTNEVQNLILDNLYYKIIRIVDNMTILDYGIDPIAYTKCSYDKNGNYFELDMELFEPGYSYGVQLMVLNENNRIEYPKLFKFKVE